MIHGILKARFQSLLVGIATQIRIEKQPEKKRSFARGLRMLECSVVCILVSRTPFVKHLG